MPPKLIATGAAKIPREAKFTAADSGKVFRPGEKGYHGPHAAAQETQGGWPWRASLANGRERSEHDLTRIDRSMGRMSYGIGGGALAAGTVGGVELNRYGNRKAARIRSGKDKPVRVHKAFTPVWHEADPLIRHARKVRGAQEVTSMPRKPNREQRFARWVGGSFDRSTSTMIGGYAGGVGALFVGAKTGGDKIKAASRDARRQKTVTKRIQPRLVLHNATRPRELVRVARENPWEAGIAAGGAGVGALAGSQDRRHRGRTAGAAAGGAAGGQLAYYGVGSAALRQAEKLKRQGQREGYNGLSRSAQEKIWRNHRQAHGYHQGQPMSVAQQRDIFLNYPKELPGARQQRFAAHMQRGKYGKLILGGATVGGAILAGGASRAIGRKQEVGKALYQREQRVSPVRAVGTAAGLGLAAWGSGRSHMLGAALSRGVRQAALHENHRAIEALQIAQAAQGVLRRGTAPGEQALRRIQAVDRAVRAVPSPIRPEVAAAAGVLLVGESRPIRREHYKPVSRPIPVRPVGW